MAEVIQFPSAAANPAPAAAMDDAPARATALDPRASFIVEAPAGSGKTGLLVQRFLKLLGESGEHSSIVQPEEVLAMTFTRKATAEMHERVLKELQAAADDAPLRDPASTFERETRTLAEAALTRSAQLGWDLLAQPRRLNIRSILSVCVELANAMPLVSGSGGRQEPLEFAGPLYRRAARQTLLQLGGEDAALSHALTTVLLHRDGSLADCERLLASMLEAREQWGELIPLDGPIDDAHLDAVVRPRLERSLEAIVCAGLQRAADAMPAGLLADLTTFAAEHAHLPGYKDALSPLAVCAGKHLPPQAVANHLDHWRALIRILLKPSDGGWRAGFARNHIGFEIPKPSATYLKDLITTIQSDRLQAALAAVLDLPSPVYPEEQWAVCRALFHVLRHALVELKLIFAARSACDFTEFALNARTALLNGDSGLTLPAGGRLRHLLIDEMQDTSTSQYGLIEALTQSFDGHSQTLFLVGDPKQSIYLFRQARVERFLRTMREQRLGELHLTPLRLTANFRSQAALVAGFNDTFGGTTTTAPIFQPLEDAASDDVPFVRATAVRPQTQREGILWHTSVFSKDDPALEDAAAEEARTIRTIVEQRLATPLPPGRSKPWRIAILARARGHLDTILREFKAHDGLPAIAYRGINLDPLHERPEVLDLLALTRALLHPADRIAWLAVLHAPWCGLGISDLLALTEGVPADATIATLVAERCDHLSPLGQQLLARCWPVIEAALATLGRTSLALHIERLWLSLGGDAPLTAEQRNNAQRYLTVLRDLEAEASRIELATLTARLQSLFAEPRTGEIHVELTTIHNAKGLEWDVVLVPGLHRTPRATGSSLLNWLELDGVGPNEEAAILLAPIWGKGKDSDRLNDWLKSVRTQRTRAEEKRLFYVAATRAQEELHLFATLTLNAAGELPAPASGTLLRACWPAAEPHFNNQRNDQLDSTSPGAGAPHLASEMWEPLPPAYEELALAAAAEYSHPTPPTVQRLPLDFNPHARFAIDPAQRLRYTTAESLRQSAAFTRPEGGFAVRAFGNVVHRYLQLLAARFATGLSADALLAELPAWPARLEASLRGEGLPPAIAKREAAQALRALQQTLADPIGRWLLAPHLEAASERDLQLPTGGALRVDRTFRAAHNPLTPGDTHIWIVDFKTTEQGSRSDDAFRAAELAKYSAQLEAYATLRRTLPGGNASIRLGLYYPLIPRLLHWNSETS
jgi:ATP-dependent exoDNAse (exonuclease V) beta subunit